MRRGRFAIWASCAALSAGSMCVFAQDRDPFAPMIISDVPQVIEIPAEIDQIEAAPGELHSSISLAEDAARGRQLRQAVQLVERSRYDDAALALGRLAESVGDGDVFIRIGDQHQSLGSLKAEIQEAIGRLPPAGRQAYEIAFGRAAQRMLDDAGHDPAAIQHVASLYLHTHAGSEALYRLAAIYRDRGAFPEAVACLERLRTQRPDAAERFEPQFSIMLAACQWRCGEVAAATSTFERLTAGAAKAVTIGGTPVSIGGDEMTAEARLEQLFGRRNTHGIGDVIQNIDNTSVVAAAATGLPFPMARWSREIAVSASSGTSPAMPDRLPVLFPSIVGDHVLLPTGRGFVAYDRLSGEPSWSYPAGDNPEPSDDAVWRNRAAGRLCTDGRAVFLVESVENGGAAELATGPMSATPFPINGFAPQQQMAVVQAIQWRNGFESEFGGDAARLRGNQLAALDVSGGRQGNRLWIAGGISGGVEPLLAGHRFLGPPLTTYGRLYALTEFQGTIRLVVLDAATGRCEWMLALGQSDVPLALDPQRREIGATPVLAQGILICPTGGGAVVAVDLAGRSLRWGYRYPRSQPPGVYAIDSIVPTAPAGGWCDNPVHIAGHRVLLTPPEAEHLYCLDLFRGDLVWQQARGDRLFLAHADPERVLLVSHSGSSMLSMPDGTAWGSPAPFPDGLVPSGRGLSVAGRYLQPLSGGQVALIDLRTGSLELQPNASSGPSLGNLTWHDDVFYSAGPEFLHAVWDEGRQAAEVDQRLALIPDDAQALLLKASQHSVAGRVEAAIADCRRAYAIAPGPRTRNALTAALLDGIRRNLPDADQYDSELADLARDARLRAKPMPSSKSSRGF